jgi:pimeloyl-ACP methyl ester carboxylesterase
MSSNGVVSAGTRQAPWQLAEPWGANGRLTLLPDGWTHWIEFGSQSEGPPIVLVHGLGGSHLNWVLIGPQLAVDRRVLAPDLRGFGLTPPGRHLATIPTNLKMLHYFIEEVAGEPVILVGNSMGGMLSILYAHAHPENVAGLALISPALPARLHMPDLRVAGQVLTYAIPGLGQAYLKQLHGLVPPRQLVRQVIDLCYADPSRADPAMVEAVVRLANLRDDMPGSADCMVTATRSLMRVASQPLRYWAAMAALHMPVLLVGGTGDRLVPAAAIAVASARNPDWQTVIIEDVGHTPQLEAPQTVIEIVQDWLDQHPGLTQVLG